MPDSLVHIVAANVRAAFESSPYPSERALAAKAGVAPNTLRALMEPDIRAPNKRGEASPRLDVLEKVAAALGYKSWQLMVETFKPNDPPARSLKRSENDFYEQIMSAYRRLPPDPVVESNEN